MYELHIVNFTWNYPTDFQTFREAVDTAYSIMSEIEEFGWMEIKPVDDMVFGCMNLSDGDFIGVYVYDVPSPLTPEKQSLLENVLDMWLTSRQIEILRRDFRNFYENPRFFRAMAGYLEKVKRCIQ